MKKVIVAGFVGGIILFLWGFLAWTVLPLHTQNSNAMNNEDAVIAAMKTGMDKKAVYFFPAMPQTGMSMTDEQKAAHAVWEAKYTRGPVGMVIYDPAGTSPMMPGQMIVGFINGVLSAMLAAWLLSRSTAASSSYFSRVAFCGALGIFASLVTHVVSWNWMGYPIGYTTGLITDAVVGWMLAGLGIGTIIKGGAA